MMPRIIRNRCKSRQPLKEIAAARGESLQDPVDQSIEDRRRIYLEGVNADYAALNGNPRAMAEFKNENSAWDVTNIDGLIGKVRNSFETSEYHDDRENRVE